MTSFDGLFYIAEACKISAVIEGFGGELLPASDRLLGLLNKLSFLILFIFIICLLSFRPHARFGLLLFTINIPSTFLVIHLISSC